MSNRTSFVLHLDSLEVLEELSSEEKGELLQAIVDFQLGKEVDVCKMVKVAFIPIKNQLLRDNEKYQETVERNKANGSKGGRPKTQNNPNNPSGLAENPSKAKKPESVNGSDNDNGKGSVKKKNKTNLPQDFSITDQMREFYANKNYPLSIDGATESWVNYIRSSGAQYVDWYAAWQNGVAKQNEWFKRDNPNYSKVSTLPNRPKMTGHVSDSLLRGMES